MRGIMMKIKISRVILKEGYKDCNFSMVYPGFRPSASRDWLPSHWMDYEQRYAILFRHL